ncbi:MAG: methylated-DNA--[protein]-cysteine S-methyltransferase, partial [Myxococcota bacterium]
WVDWLDTALGPMIAVADDTSLHLLEFADRRALGGELRRLRTRMGELSIGRTRVIDGLEAELEAFFAGRDANFETPVAWHGTELQRAVWAALLEIPVGETRSYRQIAEQIGRPTAFRAVARANGANTLAIVVPCHRVVGSDGSLTGYGGGIWRKKKLIAIERSLAQS